jgi:hypothetical protein
MGTRSEALAGTFEQAVAEFAEAVESCSDAQWRALCGAEGWTVAATAQHVAGQFPLEREFVEEAANGGKGLTYTWDDINGKNDRRAAANTICNKDDVLALLRKDGAAMSAYVRSLSDEQLDRTAPLALADGAAVSTQQLIEGGVLIEHLKGHLQSIRSAM